MKTKLVLMLLALTLIVGCDRFTFAPEVFVTYVMENRDPLGRSIVIRLFSAEGGLVDEYDLDPGMIGQDQKEIATIDRRYNSKYADYRVQVVWTVSIITSSGRDSVVASASMELRHGRTARIVWRGKLEVKGQTVPNQPINENTESVYYINTDSRSTTIPHAELVQQIKSLNR
ncbi:MAG: hypothetical protein WC575_00285 [Patescibacteria group bacterium]